MFLIQALVGPILKDSVFMALAVAAFLRVEAGGLRREGACLLTKSWEEEGAPTPATAPNGSPALVLESFQGAHAPSPVNSHVDRWNIDVPDTWEGAAIPASLTHQKVRAQRQCGS